MLLNQPRLTPPKSVRVFSTTPVVVTLTTDALLPGMSLVIPYAGSWNIDFSTSVIFNSNGDQAFISIYQGGVLVPQSVRQTGASSTGEGGTLVTTALLENVAAGVTIDIRARVNAAASATFYERVLRIMEGSL